MIELLNTLPGKNENKPGMEVQCLPSNNILQVQGHLEILLSSFSTWNRSMHSNQLLRAPVLMITFWFQFLLFYFSQVCLTVIRALKIPSKKKKKLLLHLLSILTCLKAATHCFHNLCTAPQHKDYSPELEQCWDVQENMPSWCELCTTDYQL